MKIQKVKDWLHGPQFKFLSETSATRLKDGKIFSSHDLEIESEKRTYPSISITHADVSGLKATVCVFGWVGKFHKDCIHIQLYQELLVIIDEIGHGTHLLRSNSDIEINDMEDSVEKFKKESIEFVRDNLDKVNNMGKIKVKEPKAGL